jgi:hypothetical protein
MLCCLRGVHNSTGVHALLFAGSTKRQVCVVTCSLCCCYACCSEGIEPKYLEASGSYYLLSLVSNNLVEALCHKSKGHEFDSRWRHRILQLTSLHALGFTQLLTNEYQESSLE